MLGVPQGTGEACPGDCRQQPAPIRCHIAQRHVPVDGSRQV